MEGKGMAARVGCGGHHEAAPMPKLGKGMFEQVGTGIAEGDMNSVSPSGISVNRKTGTTQTGD